MLSDALLQLLPKILVVVLNERIFFSQGWKKRWFMLKELQLKYSRTVGALRGAAPSREHHNLPLNPVCLKFPGWRFEKPEGEGNFQLCFKDGVSERVCRFLFDFILP